MRTCAVMPPQVMAREMFNPNLALFVAVPDGGSTFQPNASSHVQSDRGTSHLDYFRCVVRLDGHGPSPQHPAMQDGQCSAWRLRVLAPAVCVAAPQALWICSCR